MLYDGASEKWRAYGIFPGGSGDHRLSSPVGNGLTAAQAVDDLIRMKVPVASGMVTALWALGDAMTDLAESIRRDLPLEHVWFKCEQPCEKIGCVYCDGGLAYCVVCECGEAELEPTCPGAPR